MKQSETHNQHEVLAKLFDKTIDTFNAALDALEKKHESQKQMYINEISRLNEELENAKNTIS